MARSRPAMTSCRRAPGAVQNRKFSFRSRWRLGSPHSRQPLEAAQHHHRVGQQIAQVAARNAKTHQLIHVADSPAASRAASGPENPHPKVVSQGYGGQPRMTPHPVVCTIALRYTDQIPGIRKNRTCGRHFPTSHARFLAPASGTIALAFAVIFALCLA